MLKQGLTREEILKIPKEDMKRLVKETLQRHKRKQKRLQKKKTKKVKFNAGKIRVKKVKSKKDKNQRTLDSFLNFNSEESTIEKLKKELYSITNKLASTNGSTQRILSDKVFELMKRIEKLKRSN